MSYARYLRGQASECVGAALETAKSEEAASLLDLAQDYFRVATVTEPASDRDSTHHQDRSSPLHTLVAS